MNTIKYEADLTNRGKKVASFNMRESQTRVLFDSIKRQTEESIEKGFQVVYSNGSRRSYKTYMEMNIRSTVQSIALGMMESSAGRLGIEMFLASEHADCADDHVPWQGKVYIADNIPDRWNGKYERIGVAKAAGFTTRPNCRHYWMPITENQANNLAQTKAELRTQKGTYREKNYKDLVKQRYNERNIRKYKSRVANAEKMLAETTDPKLHEVLMNDIARNNQYVRAWQKRQRDLLAKNTYLKREYRRESPSKMAQDLGVSIELKRLQKDAKSSIIDIEIDELTECLRERKTGKLVDTVYHLASKDDIDQSKQWRKIKSDSFDWDTQKKKSEKVFSLKLENSDIVEGFLGITYKPQNYAVFVDLVESNPKNIGRNGEFEGVGPHLFAMAIKEAKLKGFDAVYFTPKTALIDHYSRTLGAYIFNGRDMIIVGNSFNNLYEKYFGGKDEEK